MTDHHKRSAERGQDRSEGALSVAGLELAQMSHRTTDDEDDDRAASFGTPQSLRRHSATREFTSLDLAQQRTA